MRIKIGKSCSITNCRSDYQPCSYCGLLIGKDNLAYSIRKKCDMSAYNVWIHFNCLTPMAKEMTRVLNKNQTKIVGEMLSRR